MKRYGTSITALALAGAITLSIAPTASAQSSVELGGSSVNAAIEEVTKPVADPIIGYLSSTASVEGTAVNLPSLEEWKAGGIAGTWGGKTWYYLADGIYVTTDATLAAAADSKATGNKETELSIIDLAVLTGRTVPANKLEALRAYYVTSKKAQVLPDWTAGGEIVVGEGEAKKVYLYHPDGIHVVTDKSTFDKAAPADAKTIYQLKEELNWGFPENWVQRSLSISASAAAAQAAKGTGQATPTTQTGKTEGSAAANFGSSQPAFNYELTSLPAFQVGKSAGYLDGFEWFYASKDWVVNSPQLVGTARQEGQGGWMSVVDFANKMKMSLPLKLRDHYQFSFNTADLAFAGMMALPALLIIGGVNWYLNQDGRTYVMDITRTSSVPTAAEREASAAMLSSNRAEVERQIQTEGNTERGITTQTGSNEFGKGLIALLIASVLGAAAFAFGRRQLV